MHIFAIVKQVSHRHTLHVLFLVSSVYWVEEILLRNHFTRLICCILIVSVDMTMHCATEFGICPECWVQNILCMDLMEYSITSKYSLPFILQSQLRNQIPPSDSSLEMYHSQA